MNHPVPGKRGRRDARHRPILRGFTLIELVVVLCIIAIMAGVAIPRFAGTLARRRVEFAASRVVNDLALAQRQARLSSATRIVVFDVATSSYRLDGLTGFDQLGAPYEVRLTDPPYEVTLLQADFGGDAQLRFDGYGVADSGGTVVLAARGDRATITFDAASGRATVQYGWLDVVVVEEVGGGVGEPPGH